MPSKITLGGRISLLLALIWAVGVIILLRRGPLSGYCEFPVVTMTLPLGAIDNIGGIFARRGVMELDEIFASYLLMIPNVFLLGYRLSGCYGLVKRLAAYVFTTSVDPDPKSKIHKAESGPGE